MIAELRSERERIEQAILLVERLARGQGKRRGRPPKWMSEAKGQDSASTGNTKKRTPRKQPAKETRSIPPKSFFSTWPALEDRGKHMSADPGSQANPRGQRNDQHRLKYMMGTATGV